MSYRTQIVFTPSGTPSEFNAPAYVSQNFKMPAVDTASSDTMITNHCHHAIWISFGPKPADIGAADIFLHASCSLLLTANPETLAASMNDAVRNTFADLAAAATTISVVSDTPGGRAVTVTRGTATPMIVF